jgi:hypothetical protein
MSLFADSAANAHLTISAPGVSGIGTGAYTVAVLYKPNFFVSAVMIWRAIEPSDFSHRGLYVDGDMWVVNQQADVNIPSFSNPPQWYWFVVTKGTPNEPPRAHWAVYNENDPMVWVHIDALSEQTNQSTINRICLGNEFDESFKGHIACIVAFDSEFSDLDIEDYLGTHSAGIMSANPQFFVQWPESEGIASPFEDLAGGGVELIRTGTWATSADPPGYDFSLIQARTGKPKIWSGSAWESKPAKSYNGTIWSPHSMNGYDGTEWVASK